MLRTVTTKGNGAESKGFKVNETLSFAAKRVSKSDLFALRINANPKPHLLLQEGAGTCYITMAFSLRIRRTASSLFHQLLLLDLTVRPAQRKIVRRSRILIQIVRL